MGWNKVAVVGVGMTQFGELFDCSYEKLIEDAYLAVVKNVDKGFEPRDIQAAWLGTALGTLVGIEGPGGGTLAANIGLAGIPVTRVENGCSTGGDAFRNACLGVASGVYDVVLVLGCEKMREKSSDEGMLALAGEGHPVITLGNSAPSYFAVMATRHIYEFGTTREQLAMISVKNRQNAVVNPKAHYRSPITVEMVLNSPPVCWPLNLFDCCPVTDGAAAAILCRADLAERYTDKPVYVAGFGLGTDQTYYHDKYNFIEFRATVEAARHAYSMAGIGPKQIDVAEVHDCFTITEILAYEDLGFCTKGEGGKLVEKGETGVRGRIPVNPSGGLLGKGHPLAATGLAQIAELFWQLRGEAGERQVEIRSGHGLQHNVGGAGIAVSSVNILTLHL